MTVSAKDLWQLLDDALSLASPSQALHQRMVGFLAFRLARAAGLPPHAQRLTLKAAFLHNIGAVLEPGSPAASDLDAQDLLFSRISASLLEGFPAFQPLAAIVRHCHTPCRGCPSTLGEDVSVPAGLVRLADALSFMLSPKEPPLFQAPSMQAMVRDLKGDEFDPLAVSALETIPDPETLWMDMAYCPGQVLETALQGCTVPMEEALSMARLISALIDFRSPFTATHSACVAAVARALASLCGMSREECLLMEIAGNLHDLGMLKVPVSLLEKPGPLTFLELHTVREHPYFTGMLLSRVSGFEPAADWARMHHEAPDGTGYPCRLPGDALPLGAEVLSLAECFCALSEDRPYRRALPDAAELLWKEALFGRVSMEAADVLNTHWETLSRLRRQAAQEAQLRYSRFLEAAGKL